MKRLITAISALALLALPFVQSANAAFPWGTGDPQQASGATPSITYSGTSFFAVEDMTANVTSLTLAGMTAGTYYSIVWMQDGTGSRTLTQSSITQATGGPALPAIPSAANKYTVWYILATSATAATFVNNYDNAPLFDTFAPNAIGGSTPAVAGTTTAQAAPTEVVPGMSTSHVCSCLMQAPDTATSKMNLYCVPLTNAAECVYANATAGSLTATAGSINIRIGQ